MPEGDVLDIKVKRQPDKIDPLDIKVKREPDPKPKEVRRFATDEEDYDSFEMSGGDTVAVDPEYTELIEDYNKERVVIDPDYKKQLDDLKKMPEKVVVDQAYLSSPEHHKDKVIIDPTYMEAIRTESPEDYITELPSELLQEIEEGPEDKEANEAAVAYEQRLESIAAKSQSELLSLKNQRAELHKAILLKKGNAAANYQKLFDVNRSIGEAGLRRSRNEDRAARELEAKAIQRAETYEPDPEKTAAALKRYEAACASIEDDYEGDMAEIQADYSRLYGEFVKSKFSPDFKGRERVVELKRMIETTLPNLRQRRIEEAGRVFQEEMTPTMFEQNLFELTVAFEKKVQHIQGMIDGLEAGIKRLSPEQFAEQRQEVRGRINALKNEARHVAKQYSRDVETLKQAEQKRVAEKQAASENRREKEQTVPPEQAALLFTQEIQVMREEEDAEPEIEVEVEIILDDNEADLRTESARVSLETTVLGDEDGEYDAEDRAFIAKEYEKQCQRIAQDFEQKLSAATKEFSPLYQRLINEFPLGKKGVRKNAPSEEEAALRRKVANLRYEIDVKLDSDRKAEMTKARQAYERAMTPTTFEKELFAATVKFERQALRIEEQKKNIRGMMTLVEEYPDALDNYREELKKMDDNMKSLAKKYGEEIDMLKNEQLIIASNRAASRPDIQPADTSPSAQSGQVDYKKAA